MGHSLNCAGREIADRLRTISTKVDCFGRLGADIIMGEREIARAMIDSA